MVFTLWNLLSPSRWKLCRPTFKTTNFIFSMHFLYSYKYLIGLIKHFCLCKQVLLIGQAQSLEIVIKNVKKRKSCIKLKISWWESTHLIQMYYILYSNNNIDKNITISSYNDLFQLVDVLSSKFWLGCWWPGTVFVQVLIKDILLYSCVCWFLSKNHVH